MCCNASGHDMTWHVSVMLQEIREIVNLDECVLLEKLWIVENEVRIHTH